MESSKKNVERRGTRRGRRHGDGYDAETLYQFYKEAGGNVAQAMRLAEGNGRVPRDKHTWSRAVERLGYRERYRQETEQEWREFGRERLHSRQHQLDTVAEAFEQFLTAYTTMLRQAFKAINGKGDQAGLLLLRKDFPFGIEQFDRFFRMYLRAMGMPERITSDGKQERTVTVVKTLTPEQKRQLLEHSARIRGCNEKLPVARNAREAELIARRVKLLCKQD